MSTSDKPQHQTGNCYAWEYKAGEPRKNRVHLYVRQGRSHIQAHWHEDGRPKYRSLGKRSRWEAIAWAERKAEQLAPEPGTHENQATLLRMRGDLVGVARRVGAPEGFAPSIRAYQEHGTFGVHNIRAAFNGYNAAGNPVDQWSKAIKRFGLTPYNRHYHANYLRVAKDVYRVANELGDPLTMPPRATYVEMGEWTQTTVMARVGVKTWEDVADTLGLEPNLRRRPRHSSDSENREAA